VKAEACHLVGAKVRGFRHPDVYY